MTLIWPSLIILHSPTSKPVHTMLHFKNTSSDRSVSTFLLCSGVAKCPHSWKPFPLVHLKPEWQMYGAQLVSVCHMWRYCQPRSQPAMSHSHPLHVSIWLKAWPLKHQLQCHCGVLVCMWFANNFCLFGGGSSISFWVDEVDEPDVMCCISKKTQMAYGRRFYTDLHRSCRYKGLEKRTC